MTQPIFSIITVTYNAGHSLEKTIQNILSQTYKEIEIIIIDGNSTDNTPDIIHNYQDKNIVCLSEPDNGLYDAMNKGLKLAKGSYVWFINAGDLLYDNQSIENIVKQLSDHLPDIIYGETAIIDKDGKQTQMRRLKAPKHLTWKSFNMGMLVCHQSFIVKKEIAEPYNLNYRYASDFDWCIRCLKKTNSIFNTNQILSKFEEGGISTINRKDGLKERFNIMSQFYGKLPTLLRHFWFAIRFLVVK